MNASVDQEQAGAVAELTSALASAHAKLIYAGADSARLDWLDTTNARFRMGWDVGCAPAGNVSVKTIIMGGKKIREAIDAAMPAEALASREEAPATPQAGMSAPTGRGADRYFYEAGYEAGRRHAITQPTTVQQAEGVSLARIEKLAADICAGSGPEESLVLVSSFMRECAALNGMQPGERKEGL